LRIAWVLGGARSLVGRLPAPGCSLKWSTASEREELDVPGTFPED
jgi:hypothetical protein